MSHVVGPNDGNLPPDAAHAILGLRFDDTLTQRMHELAERNRQDTLTDTERNELESYLRVGQLLNLLQAKAHLSLKRGIGSE